MELCRQLANKREIGELIHPDRPELVTVLSALDCTPGMRHGNFYYRASQRMAYGSQNDVQNLSNGI